MSERLTADILKKFLGLEVDPIKTKIRAKYLSAFAEAVGFKDKKYMGETPALSPAYIGTLIVKGLFSLADAKVKNDKGEDMKLITNPGKILHGSMGYKYYDTPLKDGDILFTSGSLTSVYIKNDMLFLYAKMVTQKSTDGTKPDGPIVQETNIGAICRKGGF